MVVMVMMVMVVMGLLWLLLLLLLLQELEWCHHRTRLHTVCRSTSLLMSSPRRSCSRSTGSPCSCRTLCLPGSCLPHRSPRSCGNRRSCSSHRRGQQERCICNQTGVFHPGSLKGLYCKLRTASDTDPRDCTPSTGRNLRIGFTPAQNLTVFVHVEEGGGVDQ